MGLQRMEGVILVQRAGNKSGVRVDVIFQATWLVQDEMQRAQVIPRP